jgi:hypothetical protein
MSHFAKVEDGVVTQVLVAEQDFINSGAVGDPAQWIQTSYNTRAGVHYEPNSTTPSADQSKALRKNYAGIGYSYDAGRDAFIPPKPYASWVIDEATAQYVSPIAYPTDGQEYDWDEATVSWVVVTPEETP